MLKRLISRILRWRPADTPARVSAEALEPRVLYAADPFGGNEVWNGAAEVRVWQPSAMEPSLQALAETAATEQALQAGLSEPATVATDNLVAFTDATAHDIHTHADARPADAHVVALQPGTGGVEPPAADADRTQSREIVFVDVAVNDADSLLDQLLLSRDNASVVTVVQIGAGEDGLAAISRALSAEQGVTALHIISHGDEGRLLLGGSVVDAASLQARATELGGWAAALSDQADILLYGCDVASTPEGQEFVNSLARLTGADVAASVDATGSAAAGGDWRLEYASGAVQAQVLADAVDQQDWQGLLATYTVTNNNDNGAGSFRQAIDDANASPGADNIAFNIAGTGVHTIGLSTALPSISGTVTIDATTDDSFAANGNRPAIVLDGANSFGGDGIVITASADGSLIRGLVIRDFSGDGIEIQAGSDNNTIAGNYIGRLTAAGSDAGAGEENTGTGIHLLGSNNTIGGTTAADRNVISGNASYGVLVTGASATGNVVAGNTIGLQADGTAALANLEGVHIFSGASTNTVGGATTAHRNIISGNTQDGVQIWTNTHNNIIQNNYIGTDVTGTLDRGNGGDGIDIDTTSSGNQFLDNLISGNNANGIDMVDGGATSTTIRSNLIGTQANATSALGNTGHGIALGGTTTTTTIGGTTAGQGNTIAFNGGDGVYVSGGTGNAILGNSIHSNTGLAIDLGTDGVTANDSGDGDSGANNLQNLPVLTSAAVDGSQVVISGSLNSEASTTYRIEFFANTANDNEGERYLGYTDVTTPAGSPYTVSFKAALNAAVSAGETITATATDPSNNTSEFSAQIAATNGMGIWANNNATPEVASWTGSGFGSQANSQSTGNWMISQMAEAPTRHEIIAVGVDAAGLINGQIWNGYTWSAFSFNNLVDLTTTGLRSVQLAYEQQSGDAMLVWDNATTGTASLSYRTWNGTSWSAAQTITTPVAGEAAQMRLAADPNSDSMVLAVSGTPASNDYALVWTGSSWGNAVTLDTATGADRTEIHVAYESHSGQALAVYDADGSTNAINYRTWDGSSWSAQQSLAAPAGIGASIDANFSIMASDPNSDRVALGVVTDNSEIWISVWDGSAWGSQVAATTSAAVTTAPIIGLAFEHDSGHLLAAYGKSGSNSVFHRTWTPGGAWSSELTGPNVGAVPNSVVLSADPNSDRIMLGTHDANSDINFTEWTGSAWNAVSGDMTTNTGITGGHEPLAFAWYDNNRTPVIGTTALLADENGTVAGAAAASDADGDPLLYSIIGGADAASFTIDASTGVLSFVTPPDHENPTDSGGNNVYDVIIRASDQTGGTDSQTIAVTVTNLNEAPTFTSGAGSGMVTTSASSFWDGASATLIQPDGKILMAGSLNSGSTLESTVARYNVDGTLDAAFGTSNGVFSYSFSPSNDGLYGLALQTDGKILAVGYARNGSTDDFLVVRWNANGTLDTSFDGDGIALIDFAGGHDTGRGIAVQSDGKIVVSGIAAVAGNDDFAVARLNTNGSLDTGFETDGKVTTAIGAAADEARGLALQTDGKIVLAGYSHNGSNLDVALVRYNTDGSLDTSFDGDGRRTLAIGTGYDVANAVALQTDGKIVVAGDSQIGFTADFTVMRFNADGSLDASFDGDGIVTTNVSGSSDTSKAMSIQTEGRIVVVGEAYMANNDFAVVRYNTNGSLDTTFDTDGIVTTAVGAAVDSASAVALQSDGKIVAAGYATFANGDAQLVRYNSSGSLDTTFGATSTLNGAPTYVENGAAVVLDADVQVTDPELGAVGNYSGATFTLGRHGGTNSQDSFSATGNLAALTQGGNLILSGVTIGAVTTNSAGTLLLTFNGSATQARVNETLRSIAYANTSDAPPASVQINWTFNDGNGGSQGAGGTLAITGSTTVTLTPVNDAPALADTALSITVAEDAGAPSGAVGSLISAFTGGLTDVDSGAVKGIAITATVETNGTWYYSTNGGANWSVVGAVSAASSLLLADDGNTRLYFAPAANDTGTSSAALTLRGWDRTSGTAATKVDTTSNGATTAFSSATDAVDVTVTAVNEAPVNTAPGSIAVTEDVASALTGISIADVDAASGPMLVTLSAASGTLAATSGGGVTVGGTSSALTLTGTVADINAFIAASSVSYTTAANANGSVTLTVLTSDQGNTGAGGALNDSDNLTLSITAVNDAPVLANGSTLAYTENQAATAINTAITVADIDNATLATATVQITGNHQSAEDVLAFTNVAMGNIAGVWNSGTGTITLTSAGATATLAQWQAAVRAVTYANNSDNPSTLARTVSYTVNDGALGSNTVTSTINITAVNDVPTLANLAGDALAYAEGDGAVLIEQGANATVADVDSTDLNGGALTVSFAAGSDSAEDVLAVRNQGTGAGQIGVSGFDVSYGGVAIGTWAGGSGGANLVISFNASATPAAAQALVRNISYQNTDSNAPTTGARSVRFVLTDGDGGTSANHDVTVTVSAVNDAPVNAVPGSISVTEDVATALTGISIADVDAASGSMLVTLSTASGTLAATSGGGVAVGGTSSALTLTGTVADINAFIAASSVSYTTAANANGSVTLTVLTSDQGNTGAGGALNDSDNLTLSITAVNDAPVLANGSTLGYTENQAATAINTAITVADVDNATLATATVQITANYQSAEDVLAFTNVGMGNITGVWNSGTGTMTLSSAGATATVAQWQAALRAVTYANSSDNPSTAARAVSFALDDGALGSNTVTSTVNITAVNDVPTLANLAGDALAYAEGDGAVLIEQGSDATAADGDSADFGGGALTVSFAAGSDSAEDVLAVRNQGTGAGQIGVSGFDVSYGGVTIGTWAGGSGGANLVISFNASATPAAAQALVRNISYQNTDSNAPTTGARTVRYVLTDGDGGTSANHDATVTVSAVNDAPVLPDTALSMTVAEDAGAPSGAVGSLISAFTGGLTDVDSGAVKGIAITATVETNGSWYYSTDGGTSWNLVGAVSNTSALLLADDGNTRLYFSPTANFDGTSAAALTLRAWDQTSGPAGTKVSTAGNGGTAAFSTTTDTVDVTITAVNDAPSAAPASASGAEDAASIAITLGGSDIDGTVTHFRLGTLPVNGLLYTDASLTTLVATGIDYAATGQALTLYFVPAADWNGSDTFLFQARDDGGLLSAASATASITVSAVNDAPVVNAVGLTLSEGDTVTLAPAHISVTDPDGSSFAYTVSGLSGGYFQLSTAAGTPITSFTSAQLSGGLVQFVDDGNEVAPTFSLTASDGTSNSNTLAANINYTPANDAPVLDNAAALAFNPITEDQVGNGGQTVASMLASAGSSAVTDADLGAVQGIAVNFTDPGNGSWQFSTDGGNQWQAVAAVSDSAALLLRSGDLIRFVPNGQEGTSASVSFRAWDRTSGAAGDRVAVGAPGGSSAFSTASARAGLSVSPVNDAPTTHAVLLAPIAEGSGPRLITQTELLALAQDVDGDALQAVNLRISGGAGSLVDNGNGTWTYRAPLNFNGPVLFSYEVSDGTLLVAGSARLDITPVNDRPVASPVTLAAIAEDSGPRLITQAELLSQAGDADADTLVVSGLSISAGAGTLVDNADGTWTFTPAPNDNGRISFSYRIGDGNLGTDASATLQVNPVNDAPELHISGQTAAVSLVRDENSTGAATASASDVDDASQALRFSLVGGADAALFGLDSVTGELTFIQAPDFENPTDANADGIYEVRLRVQDKAGASAELALRVRIGDINDPPVLDMPASIQFNAQPQPDQVVATAGGSDQDAGDKLQFELLDDAGGRFAIDAKTGDIRFTGAAPAASGSGSVHTLLVQVTDSQGGRQFRALALVVPGRVALSETQPLAPAASPSPSAVDSDTKTQQPVDREDNPDKPAATVGVAAGPARDEAVLNTRERLAGVLRELQDPDAEVLVQHKDAAARDRSDSPGATATPSEAPKGSSVLDTVGVLVNVDGDGQALPVADMLGRQWGSGRRSSEDGSDNEQDALASGTRKSASEPVDQLLLQFTKAEHVASMSLSVGLVWWLTRGGGLLASAMMGAPAWKQVDLLAVMSTHDDDEADDETDEVKELFNGQGGGSPAC